MLAQSQWLSGRRGAGIEAKIVAFYLFLLVFGSIYGSQIAAGLQQGIIWVSSPILVAWILLPKIMNESIVVPKPLWLYAALIIFALLGLPLVIEMDFYTRYLRVLSLNFLLMVIVVSSIKTWDDLLVIFNGVGLACIFIVVVSYFVESAEARSDEYYRFNGILGNANGLASAARVGIFCCFLYMENNKKKLIINVLLIGLIIFLCYSILLSASRGNFINLLILLGGYFYIKFFSGARVILLFIISFFLGSILVTVFDKFLQGFFLYQRLFKGEHVSTVVDQEKRADIFVTAVNLFLEHPILGVGFGQFRVYNEDGLGTHSDFIDIFVQLGVFAGIIYMWMYINIARGIIKAKKNLDKVLNNKSAALLLLMLITEVEFGIGSPNWYDQTEMVLVTLVAAAASPNIYKGLLKTNNPS